MEKICVKMTLLICINNWNIVCLIIAFLNIYSTTKVIAMTQKAIKVHFLEIQTLRRAGYGTLPPLPNFNLKHILIQVTFVIANLRQRVGTLQLCSMIFYGKWRHGALVWRRCITPPHADRNVSGWRRHQTWWTGLSSELGANAGRWKSQLIKGVAYNKSHFSV